MEPAHQTRLWARTRIAAGVLALLAVGPAAASTAIANGGDDDGGSGGGGGSATLRGLVLSGTAGLPGYEVTLYAARGRNAAELGSTRSRARGAFRISYRPPSKRGTVLYLTAERRLAAGRAIALASVLGTVRRPGFAVINERTTVATGTAMAQFTQGRRINGNSPGLQNAAGMARNMVRPRTGRLSRVLSRFPNGGSTSALRTFNSLANMVAACVRSRPRCGQLFRLTGPPGEGPSASTLGAIVNLTHHPSGNRRRLFRLARSTRLYRPDRGKRPSAWIVALRFDGDGRSMDGPGNIAFDAGGNAWVVNNYEFAPRKSTPVCGGKQLLRFTPRGRYFPGSPYSGGGVNGGGFGIGIDPVGHVWVGNFGFAAPVPGCPADQQPPANSISEFTPRGQAVSPDVIGYTAGGVSFPQGTVSDRKGNIWVANCGNDSVTRSPAGEPDRAANLSQIGITHPFDVAIGREGRAFVTGTGNSRVAVLNNDGSLSRPPVVGGGLDKPMGVATDSGGFAWIANQGAAPPPCPPPINAPSGTTSGSSVTLLDPDGDPVRQRAFEGGGLRFGWGIAVDGDDNVWVANFGGRRLSLFCGRRTGNCPPGKQTGDPISPDRTGYGFDGLVRVTGVEIDPSGNAWLVNNWKLDPGVPVNGVYTLQNPGGYQLVVYVGVAAPVRTPLIGPVRSP